MKKNNKNNPECKIFSKRDDPIVGQSLRLCPVLAIAHWSETAERGGRIGLEAGEGGLLLPAPISPCSWRAECARREYLNLLQGKKKTMPESESTRSFAREINQNQQETKRPRTTVPQSISCRGGARSWGFCRGVKGRQEGRRSRTVEGFAGRSGHLSLSPNGRGSCRQRSAKCYQNKAL